ncbi:hypothetical protein [Pseudomonas leptonychotis]|uniref:hypothetical protein n=1 Tax=Pseudomonas leptonychotis TaxID=2448482 RepID=UPI003864498D
MINLVKKGDNWRDWEVLFKGETHSLQQASHVDTNLYQFPDSIEDGIDLSDISELQFLSLPKELKILLSNTESTIHPLVNIAFINTSLEKAEIEAFWTITPKDWKDPTNPILLIDKIIEIHDKRNEENEVTIIQENNDENFLDLFFYFKFSKETKISEAFKAVTKYLLEIQNEAYESIYSQDTTHKIIARFSFKPEFQNSCSRYILYFIEFLRDMGIEANSDLKKKGLETLFTIEPLSKDTSLKNIKDALGIYLSLPEIDSALPENKNLDPIVEFKIEKLSAEILSLKSNNRIQEALLKIQSEKIDNLSNKFLTLEAKTPLNGLQSVTTQGVTENKDVFLGGAIKLGKFQKLGIEFDWSAIRKLIQRK